MTKIVLPEEPERASLEKKLQYVGESAGWAGLWQYEERQIELRIEGGESETFSGYLSLAQIVLPKLAEIEKASNEYLRAFVGDGDGFYRGNWKIQSLRMRRFDAHFQESAGRKFEVTLKIGEDDCGEWSVGFIYDTFPLHQLEPYFFSRRQC